MIVAVPFVVEVTVNAALVGEPVEVYLPSIGIYPGTGLTTLEPLDVDAEPIDVLVGIETPLDPVFTVGVEMLVPTVSRPMLALAPIDIEVSVRAPSALRVRRALMDPPDEAVIPVARPTFVVVVGVVEGELEDVTVEVQYDDNAGFTSPVTLTADEALVLGANTIAVPAQADITPLTVHYWRARLVLDGAAMEWTPAWTFTVDPSAGEHEVPILWTVAAGSTDPHLWFVTPAAGTPGEQVTIVGQGFPAAEGTVTLAGTAMPIVSWTHVAATAEATTADRVITETLVDPEHDEIVATVPDGVDEPGGALVVEGDDAP